LQVGDGDHLGHDVFDQLGVAGLEVIEQVLGLLAAQQFV